MISSAGGACLQALDEATQRRAIEAPRLQHLARPPQDFVRSHAHGFGLQAALRDRSHVAGACLFGGPSVQRLIQDQRRPEQEIA